MSNSKQTIDTSVSLNVRPLQLWNPDSLKTAVFENKNFTIKETLPKRLYNLRLKFGRLQEAGLVPDTIKVLKPLLDDNFPLIFTSKKRSKFDSQSLTNDSNMLQVDFKKSIYKAKLKEEINQFDILKFDHELNCDFQESKRELNLKAMLDEKLKKLSTLLQECNQDSLQ